MQRQKNALKTGDRIVDPGGSARTGIEPLQTSGRELPGDIVAQISRRLSDQKRRRAEFSKPKEFRDRPGSRGEGVRGLVLRVEPGGTLTWFLDYRCQGMKKRGKNAGKTVMRSSRFKLGNAPEMTLAEAREDAGEEKRKLKKGGKTASNDPNFRERHQLSEDAKAPTLGAFIDSDYKDKRHASARKKAHGDPDDLERLLKRADTDIDRVKTLFVDFLPFQLTAISKADVERYRTRRLNEGKMPATINRDVAVLRGVLTTAVELDLLPFNPLHRLKDYSLNNEVERRLEGDEQERLMLALDQHEQWVRANTSKPILKWVAAGNYDETKARGRFEPYADYLKPMILVSFTTGTRRGNLIYLRRKEVDLVRKNLRLRPSATKTNKRLDFPMTSVTAQVLEVWLAQSEAGSKPDDFVFPSAAGTVLDGNNVGRAWRRIKKLSGIENFRWQDHRHDFASNVVSRKKSLVHAQKLLGHRDPRMTMRYAHLAETELRDAATALDDVWNEPQE